ncbi:hypothetical protein HBH56_132870 [Parastagonospora nodorum]|nr:hypothetical protein HBH56_132870 [Parastagonospora nodorum]KAH3927095.1 hypothetical protein HBH54_160360 [Parastagonospora nodorum]KAH3949483.1 hypothetical protein HBH53_087830 [Parastagonospora nodorum]KAH3974898.1 hypothetical protein HBH52_133670 [Parastagonospora nodorum]KAH4066880.1 hypothetical protein HBH50_144300 [Parastagonospora nodorum]
MDRVFRGALVALALGAPLATAAPDQATTQACTEIKNALPGKVLTTGLLAVEYAYEKQQYWSMTQRSTDPACIVQPVSAEDVSAVVKILLKYPTVKMATRSGGHDPNVGHNGVEDGVLITMTDMVGATYDATKGVAYVKPGGEWNDVIGDLEPSGVTMLGGRLGIVGVGGLLLGGGLSFLSAQHGLAADNIIGWETVMANGSIINIDAKSQPELAKAMRGSGSQFGIVTTFTVQTVPIGDIWGGSCVYALNQSEALYAALHNFVANGAQDPKAAVIFTDLLLLDGTSLKLLYYFYDGPTPPKSGPFADFFKIPNLTCLPRTQKYSELVRANGAPVALLQARCSFRTYTLPYIATRPQMYQDIQAKWSSIIKPFANLLHPTSQFSVDFQPFPAAIGAQSAAKGGNAMGLSASDADLVILEIQGSWALPEDDAVAYSLSKQLTDWLDQEVPLWLDEAGMRRDIYRPLYLNDAAGDQAVMQSYKEYEQLKALQMQYDPNGLWRERAGGFKY